MASFLPPVGTGAPVGRPRRSPGAVATPAENRLGAATRLSLPDLAPATVFVAEDNPILLQGIGRALTANGYAVATAPDGAALLRLLHAASDPPDLLLLDVMMPEMSGLEVLQAVRTNPRWDGLPVMLITAATDEGLPETARRHGAVDVLPKPFRLHDLLSRIDAYIRREQPGNAGAAAALPLDAS